MPTLETLSCAHLTILVLCLVVIICTASDIDSGISLCCQYEKCGGLYTSGFGTTSSVQRAFTQ